MVINELNNRQNGAGEGESAPLESPSSRTLKTTLVEVPFTAKKRSSANASLVYGPMPSTEELEKAFSLDEYLALQTGDEEEFDYLDGLATDILRK